MLYHNFLWYFIRVTRKKKIIKVSIRKRFRPMHAINILQLPLWNSLKCFAIKEITL